jgi:hypothetical protein
MAIFFFALALLAFAVTAYRTATGRLVEALPSSTGPPA